MILYHIASITKLILGLAILFITYTSINVYEDPAVAIGLWFVGLFIAMRWGSFYIFLVLQRLFRAHIGADRIMKDSYKLSLLFGIYVMINVLFLLLWRWNKRRGIVLLAWFIGLQMLLFQPQSPHDKSNEE